MKFPAFINPGVRIATIWVIVVLCLGFLFVNRFNLAGDTAYQWIDPNVYSDVHGKNLVDMLNHWDAKWFTNLSQTGYIYKGPDILSNVVFFPLFPLSLRVLQLLTTIHPTTGGVLLNILFTLGASGLLYLLARKDDNQRTTPLANYAMLVFPTAIFFIAPYSESLFLFLSLLFVILLTRKRYVLAFFIGCLATLTRSIGFLLVLFAIAEVWKNRDSIKNWKVWLPLFIPIGTFLFFLYERIRFGSFFVYFTIEAAWGRAFHVNWDHLWFGSAASRTQTLLDVGMLLFVLACGAYLIRKRLYAYGLYTVLLVLLPVSTGTLMSVGRYALAAFPIFFLPALIKSPNVRAMWFFVSILLFGMTTTLFLHNHWAG